MSICVIDTSVFCNILAVPGRDQQHEDAIEELEQFLVDDWSLLLPMATIYETGNHIAKATDGHKRREVAESFLAQVQQAFSGEAPWTPTPIPKDHEFVSWLADFPDAAMRGVSLADLTIIKVYEERCMMHPSRRVRIWSYDQDLAGYDRVP